MLTFLKELRCSLMTLIETTTRQTVVYIPSNVPLGYAIAEGILYLPKTATEATKRFSGGYRRVLVTQTVEEAP